MSSLPSPAMRYSRLRQVAVFEPFIGAQTDSDIHDAGALKLKQGDLLIICASRDFPSSKLEISWTRSQEMTRSRTARKISLSLTQTVSFEVTKIGSARRIVVSSISCLVRVLSPFAIEVIWVPGFSQLPSNIGVLALVAVIMISASIDSFLSARRGRTGSANSRLIFSAKDDGALRWDYKL